MAAQAPPTFKLVLVGDGGTGKVSGFYLSSRVLIPGQGRRILESLALFEIFLITYDDPGFWRQPLSSSLAPRSCQQ